MFPISHRLNQDGYFRKRWGRTQTPSGVAEMFHRYIYRAHKGEIPEGHEVDHLCGTRCCCNPDHLEAKPGLDHTIQTNQNRYADRKASAKLHWLETRCSGTALAGLFNVKYGTGCMWIREWKKELH